MREEIEGKLLYLAIKNKVSREMLIDKKILSFKKHLSEDLQEFFSKCSKEDLDLYLIKFDLFSEQEIEELLNLATKKFEGKFSKFDQKEEKISIEEFSKKL